MKAGNEKMLILTVKKCPIRGRKYFCVFGGMNFY